MYSFQRCRENAAIKHAKNIIDSLNDNKIIGTSYELF